MLTKTVECLRARGDEVLIFAPSGGPGELFGAEVVSMPSAAFPLYPELRLAVPRASMRAKIEAFRPDVLHLMEPVLLGIGGLYYGLALKIPTVVSYHTNLPAYLSYYKLGFLEGAAWRLIRQRHRHADLNLCTSVATMEELRAHGVERLALWEKAVDAERFHPRAYAQEMRRRLSGGELEKPLLLYVGRLSAEKNIGSLRDVLRAMPGLRLAIVGDGPMRRELEHYYRGTPTYFAGYMQGEELAAAYASSDVFVMPSRTETLGLVLLEAMASGCPVVACRAGGVPDAVEDGVTGVLYDPGLPHGLEDGVCAVLGNPTLLEAIREGGRADAEAHSWRRATERLTDCYGQAIEIRRRAAGRAQRKGETGEVTRRVALSARRRLLP